MTPGDGAAADAASAAAKLDDSSVKAAADVGKADARENGKQEDAKPVEKRKRQYRVDTNLLRAFRYFDRTGMTLPTSSDTLANGACLRCTARVWSCARRGQACSWVSPSLTGCAA